MFRLQLCLKSPIESKTNVALEDSFLEEVRAPRFGSGVINLRQKNVKKGIELYCQIKINCSGVPYETDPLKPVKPPHLKKKLKFVELFEQKKISMEPKKIQ